MPGRFNDVLALLVVVLCFALWSYVLTVGLDQAGVIVGATITAFTTVVFHYYRKAGPTEPKGGK